MKTMAFIFLISISALAQSEPLNCDSIIFHTHRGFVAYDKMPEPIGGLDSFHSRLKYPKEALDKNIEGKVYVIVVIDTIGNPYCARVFKSLGYGCDEEALKLIRTTKFLPGVWKGKPYNMQVTIPIFFSLKDNKKG